MTNLRLEYLFLRYFNKEASPEETDELMRLLQDPINDNQINQLISKTWHLTGKDDSFFNQSQSNELLNTILAGSAETPVVEIQKARNKRRILFAGIAASVVMIAGFAIFALNTTDRKSNTTSSQETSRTSDKIVPGSNTAQLTLADGSVILLDTAGNGQITTQGNTNVLKVNGEIRYDPRGVPNEQVVSYNSITTPRGGQYQVLLADGSRVWLNAASQLKFPTNFSNSEREVYLEGEAFFEVTRNEKQPFRVRVGNHIDVQVLGTSFNVMSYYDEGSINTTLVQGKVKIERGTDIAELNPNEEGIFDKQHGGFKVKTADVESAIAWKEGKFYFQDENIASIMRKLSRWYDVSVEYRGDIIHEKYSGSIKRQAQISQVLELLELPGGIHFSIEGRKVIVSPK